MKTKLRRSCDTVVRLLRAGFLFLFDSIVLLGCPKKKGEPAGAIFCLHGLGDLILAGNAIAGLVSHLRARGLKVVLIVRPQTAGFARRYFEADEIVAIDRHRFTRRLRYRITALKSVARRFDVAVQPMYNRMLRVEDFLVRIAGARERIGSEGHSPFISPMEQRLGKYLYTQIIRAEKHPRHELERNAEFMAGLGLRVSSEPWKISLSPPPASLPQLPASDYLVVSPNASDRRRSWPLENFIRAAQQTAARHQLTVLLVGEGGPSESSGEPDVPAKWIDLRGKIPTDLLPHVLAGARLIFSNDSGVFHLGIALRRPTVAVGGSGIPDRYFPYRDEARLTAKSIFLTVPCAGCNWRCIHTPSRNEPAWCMVQVPWQQMAAAADEFLKESYQMSCRT